MPAGGSARWLSLPKSVGDRRFASVRVSPLRTAPRRVQLLAVHGGAVFCDEMQNCFVRYTGDCIRRLSPNL